MPKSPTKSKRAQKSVAKRATRQAPATPGSGLAGATLYFSYSNSDTLFVRDFANLMRERGHRVTMFHDHLTPGDDWRRAMDEALAVADGMIVLVTENSLLEGIGRFESQWIAAEIGAARVSADKFVIPVIFGKNVAIPTLLDNLFARWFDKSQLEEAADSVSRAVAIHQDRRAKASSLQLPAGYQHLAPNILKLHEDVPFQKAVFVMMKFPDQVSMAPSQIRLLEDIWAMIESELRDHGLVALRADQRKYHDQLWENVCVYMLGCRFGIAVLEDRVASELNPNIALEYGFMRAIDRRVGLFRNAGFKHGRADLSGKLMNEFVIDDSGRLNGQTLKSSLQQWLSDVHIA
jgi:hypothetical protein